MSFDSERLIVGHRGAAGLAPENTLAGFSLAAALGVHAVELDVHRVLGRLLVIHDDRLERTTSGRGGLASLDIAGLRALDAGGGQPIPFLEEVFDALPSEVGINVELKGPHTAETVFSLLTRIRRQCPAEDADVLPTPVGDGREPRHRDRVQRDVLVSSFDLVELRRFAELGAGGFKVAPLFEHWSDDICDLAAELSAWSVNLCARAATRRRIQQALSRGFRVLVFTVNDPALAESLFSWGATGIFTDFPDRMIGRVAPARQ